MNTDIIEFPQFQVIDKPVFSKPWVEIIELPGVHIESLRIMVSVRCYTGQNPCNWYFADVWVKFRGVWFESSVYYAGIHRAGNVLEDDLFMDMLEMRIRDNMVLREIYSEDFRSVFLPMQSTNCKLHVSSVNQGLANFDICNVVASFL